MVRNAIIGTLDFIAACVTIFQFLFNPQIITHSFRIIIILVLMICVIYITLRIANKVRAHEPLNPEDWFSIVLWGISIIIIIIWLFFPPIGITLDYPINGGTVNLHTTIQGEASYIRTDRTLWVLIYSPESYKYYPQKQPIPLPLEDPISRLRSGKWSCPAVFGDQSQPDRDRGKTFDVIVVLADENANRAFQNYLNGPQVYSGMDYPLNGVEQYAMISVTRS